MLVWIIVPGKIWKNDKCTKLLDRGRELKELRTWHASHGADRGWSQWGVSSTTIHTDVSKKWATSVALLALSYFGTRNNVRNVLSGIRRKRTGSYFSGSKSFYLDESKFCFSFGKQCPSV